jgi:hypothetical protein
MKKVLSSKKDEPVYIANECGDALLDAVLEQE